MIRDEILIILVYIFGVAAWTIIFLIIPTVMISDGAGIFIFFVSTLIFPFVADEVFRF